MAVYTEVADDELAAFVAGYDIGRVVSIKGIAEGVENTNYLLDAERGRFILTLYEKRVNREDLPFFLALLEYLSRAGLTCPLPVRNRAGTALGELSARPAAIVTFLDGVSTRKPDAGHCEAVGRTLAALHLAGQSFPMHRANALGPPGWLPLFNRFKADGDKISPGLSATIEAELAALLPAWPTALPKGVIHADLFPDNVFFFDGRLSGIIDFYFACTDWLAYDVAICLNSWCFEADMSFNVTKGRALLAAYHSVRPLQPEEAAALPILARGAALRFLLTRAHDWLHTPADALVKPHDPIPYLRRLRFHQSVTSAAAYGLASARVA